MKKIEFVTQLAEELEIESEVNFQTVFKDLDEWDSLAIMVLIAYVANNFSVNLNADDVNALTTFESLIVKIGEDKFESHN